MGTVADLRKEFAAKMTLAEVNETNAKVTATEAALATSRQALATMQLALQATRESLVQRSNDVQDLTNRMQALEERVAIRDAQVQAQAQPQVLAFQEAARALTGPLLAERFDNKTSKIVEYVADKNSFAFNENSPAWQIFGALMAVALAAQLFDGSENLKDVLVRLLTNSKMRDAVIVAPKEAFELDKKTRTCAALALAQPIQSLTDTAPTPTTTSAAQYVEKLAFMMVTRNRIDKSYPVFSHSDAVVSDADEEIGWRASRRTGATSRRKCGETTARSPAS
jgi:hypothetical protein